MGSWRSVEVGEGTIFEAINRDLGSDPRVVPSFEGSQSIVVGSDYSGDSKEEPYVVYSFIFVGGAELGEWDQTRIALREAIFSDDRRMSYKKLGDGMRRRFLVPFLAAADDLNGILISVAINKTSPSLFSEAGPMNLANEDFSAFRKWKGNVLEKALSLLHITALLLAGLGREKQNVFWFTDEDQIAANPQMLTDLTKAFAWIASGYLDFDLGHLRCGTTACDDGSRQIEDFVSIPDLVAGALSEQFRASLANGVRDDHVLWFSGAGMIEKAHPILWWLTTSQKCLKKHVFVIDPAPGGDSHKISWFNFALGN